MAGLTVCDFCPSDQFVPAVATARTRTKESSSSTVNSTRRKDACRDHIADAANDCFRFSRERNFLDVVITKAGEISLG